MPEPMPSREQCVVSTEVVESIRAVTEQLIALHRQEIEAVRCWDIDTMEQIDQDLEKANQYRDSLLERLNSHVKAHRCQAPQAQGRAQGRVVRPDHQEPSEKDWAGERGAEQASGVRKKAASESSEELRNEFQ